MNSILVVDDDQIVAQSIKKVVTKTLECQVELAHSGQEAIEKLQTESFDVVLLDIRLDDASGMDLLKDFKLRAPQAEVIMMTAYATIEDAIEAVKLGAFDFITKPFENIDVVPIAIKKAVEHREMVKRLSNAEKDLKDKYGFENIIGTSPEMQRVFRTVRDVANSDATILIEGASGTGKELVARAVHFNSARSERAFLACNCSSLSESLIESELFGHVKGAFTSAFSDKRGLFEAANHGTLFLDEIGEIPQTTQVRLLRALQEGEIIPVGSSEVRRVDVRIIAATNKELDKLVEQGKFREDLYYRINVINISMPPLRERKGDIDLLVMHFIKKYNERNSKQIEGIDRATMQLLYNYSWPGNVRELENAIERAVILEKGITLSTAVLPTNLLKSTGQMFDPKKAGSGDYLTYKEAKREAVLKLTRGYIDTLLTTTKGNITKAAAIAGMERSNFKKLMNQSAIDASPYRSLANEEEYSAANKKVKAREVSENQRGVV